MGRKMSEDVGRCRKPGTPVRCLGWNVSIMRIITMVHHLVLHVAIDDFG